MCLYMLGLKYVDATQSYKLMGDLNNMQQLLLNFQCRDVMHL